MADNQKLEELDVGLDLTSDELRAVSVSKRGRDLVLENFAIGDVPSSVFAAGRVADPQTLGERIKAILADHGIEGKRAVISLSGKASVSRRVELPAMSGARIRQALKLQIGQYVPFPPGDTSYDYNVVPQEKRDVEQDQTEVLLAATRDTTIDSLMDTLDHAGLEPHGIRVTSLSAGNMLIDTVSEDYQQSVCFIDVRDSVTDLTFYQNRYFRLTRSIEVGYNTIINQISQQLEVSPDQAEDFLKEEDIDLTIPEEELEPSEDTRLRETLLEVLSNFVSELIRSIRYFEGQVGRDARVGKLYIFGNVHVFPNLDRYLEEQTGLEVSKVALSQFVDFQQGEYSIELLNENAEKLIVATSLARSFVSRGQELDLLPDTYRRKAQYKYVVAGLVLILAALSWFLYEQNSSLKEEVQTNREQLQSLENEIAKYEQDAQAYDNAKQEVNQLLPKFNEIMSIAQGQVPFPVIMQEVGRRTPDNVLVGAVNIDPSQKTVTIQGCVADMPELELYTMLLDDSAFFTNTQIGASPADSCGGGGGGGGTAGAGGGGGGGGGGLTGGVSGAPSGPEIPESSSGQFQISENGSSRLNYDHLKPESGDLKQYQFPGFGTRPGASIESFYQEQAAAINIAVWEFQIVTQVSNEVIDYQVEDLEQFRQEIEDVLQT